MRNRSRLMTFIDEFQWIPLAVLLAIIACITFGLTIGPQWAYHSVS